MNKRTKIVATLGPASTNETVISQAIDAGVNLFRMNFSHASIEEHIKAARMVRRCQAKRKAFIGLIGDLPGPKVRIGRFANLPAIELVEGERFDIDPNIDFEGGDERSVGANYDGLAGDCQVGKTLLLDDGGFEVRIEGVEGSRVITEVVRGGLLKPCKGLNLKGGGLTIDTITQRDKEFIAQIPKLDLDYLAVSFPRSAKDMVRARKLVDTTMPENEIKLISKIERAEVVSSAKALEEVILHSDAVMVARGDLGVEVGDAALIGIQKRIIRKARQLNRGVITATQMMESMVENTTPTRAEVFDVANAVLDHTDAVMLSAETATGKNPVQVVKVMSEIIQGAETEMMSMHAKEPVARWAVSEVDESIAMASVYLANQLKSLKAILCLTESGNTPLWMSRIGSGIPIYAVSHHTHTLRRVALFRGVIPVLSMGKELDMNKVISDAVEVIKSEQELTAGSTILCTSGGRLGNVSTNTIKILNI